MTTPTDTEKLAEALREILEYRGGADSALDDPYVMERAREALQARESRAQPASVPYKGRAFTAEQFERVAFLADAETEYAEMLRYGAHLAREKLAQPASVSKDLSDVLQEAELMLNKYKRLLQWDSHEWHHAEAVRSRVARAAAPPQPAKESEG